jgi:hypothetical protein
LPISAWDDVGKQQILLLVTQISLWPPRFGFTYYYYSPERHTTKTPLLIAGTKANFLRGLCLLCSQQSNYQHDNITTPAKNPVPQSN